MILRVTTSKKRQVGKRDVEIDTLNKKVRKREFEKKTEKTTIPKRDFGKDDCERETSKKKLRKRLFLKRSFRKNVPKSVGKRDLNNEASKKDDPKE